MRQNGSMSSCSRYLPSKSHFKKNATQTHFRKISTLVGLSTTQPLKSSFKKNIELHGFINLRKKDNALDRNLMTSFIRLSKHVPAEPEQVMGSPMGSPMGSSMGPPMGPPMGSPKGRKYFFQPQTRQQLMSKKRVKCKTPVIDKGRYFEWTRRVSSKVRGVISRKNYHELKAYYMSIMVLSRGDLEVFKSGFVVMLNLLQITCSDKIIKQATRRFEQESSLEVFLEVYARVIQYSLKETVMDYFEILFQDYDDTPLTDEDLSSILAERIKPEDASLIAEEVMERARFHRLMKSEEVITKQLIIQLCYIDEAFCTFMTRFDLLPRNKNKGKQEP